MNKEIKLGELEFTCDEAYLALRNTKGESGNLDVRLAKELNSILREKLAKSLKLHVSRLGCEDLKRHSWHPQDVETHPTHTARLVCIEEIKK